MILVLSVTNHLFEEGEIQTMWVFSKHGYFSAVEKPGCAPGELVIRARCKEDLERLKAATGTEAPILKKAGTDYPFRICMNREVWAKFLTGEAMSIDYPNFKDEVLFGKIESPRRRKHRHDVYFNVWKALLSLSATSGKGRRFKQRELEEHLEDDQDLMESAGADPSFGSAGTKAPGRKPSLRFRQSTFWGK